MKNFFPYPFREGQRKLIRFIQKEIWNGSVCVSAATGFGKTPVILASLLPYVEKFGAKIIWAVRTGNETDRPIEELKAIDLKKGGNFYGLSYRGKRDMCLLAREIKTEGEMDYDDVSFLCRARSDECKYRQNLEDFKAWELVKSPMLYSEILNACREREVCPYLAQRSLLAHADVVSLSYNYIVDEKMAWSIRREIPFRRSFLVVDEAHNLQHACSNLFSDKVSLGTIANAIREAEEIATPKAEGIKQLLLKMKTEIEGLLPEVSQEDAEFDARGFFSSLIESEGGYECLLEELMVMRDLGAKVRAKQLSLGRRPRSSLFHLANFCLSSLENLEVRGIAFLCTEERKNFSIERWDMRAAEVLRGRWREFLGCVFCSGTLNPVKAFAETVGIDSYSSKSVPSNFDQGKIVSLITKGLTTKGESLSREMANRYVKAIKDFAECIKANVAVFSASYRIQDGLLRAGIKEAVEDLGMRFFKETKEMIGDRARSVLENFKACAGTDSPGFLCASASGRFAEGADFPGEELVGIFLVGIPFERMSARTRIYLNYYKELYGEDKGSYYAYVVPALRRASQSLGRALRSKEDRAALVCGDERYAEKRFFRLLPDYFQAKAEAVNLSQMRRKLMSWAHKTQRIKKITQV
jgi:DNA excision repair protein ERCC-2